MSWIFGAQSDPGARIRLLCFPYAGAGSAFYRGWQARLTGIQVCAVELPGRGARVRERPFASLRELSVAASDAVQPLLSGPFALFGHSFGALLAFEIARELRRRGGPQPEHLFVSARRGPRLAEPWPRLHPLPDDAFVARIRERYDGIPAAVLQEPALLELLLPALRADVEALETYSYAADAPLACPITAFGGLDDPWASHADLEAWHGETRASFELERFPGGHFYLKAAEAVVLAALAARIGATAELAAATQ
jgi:medium-chain acyl-[acyl-carrier-protein] hydrolase